jgi:Zn finger protein HypA/HybF involved in hydrogenase expression
MLEIISCKISNKQSLSKVYVTVGPLAGIWPDALQFGFEELARQQGFSKVALVVRKTPAVCVCAACGKRYETEDVHSGCIACGSLARCIESGAEFQMDSIEVEEEN